jgi:hypothetical protein
MTVVELVAFCMMVLAIIGAIVGWVSGGMVAALVVAWLLVMAIGGFVHDARLIRRR